MRIALSGGTGFVGGHLAVELARRGHDVVALVRSPPRAAALRALGVELVEGDVTEGVGLDRWLDGCRAVVHLVGIIEERGEATFERVHVGGTTNVLRAAEEAGVGEIVHMSALGSDDRPGASEYHRTKRAAERAVEESGLSHTIFRPSVIYGPGDGFVSLLAKLLRWSPAVPLVGDGRFRLQPVWVGDVVAAFRQAVEREDLRGEAFEIGGPAPIAYREVLRTIARVQGTPRPLVPFPVAFFRAAAAIGAALPLPVPITPDQLRMLLEENVTDRNAIGDVFGIEPVPFEEGLRRYLR